MNKERREYINNEIKEHYKTESIKNLALRLGISENNVRKRASRLHIVKGTVANKIIDGEYKVCNRCHKTKHVSKYYRDCYQPNNISYMCIQCKLEAEAEREEAKKRQEQVQNNCQNASIDEIFPLKHKNTKESQAPHINSRGEWCLWCKECEKEKTLDNFQEVPNYKYGYRNICRVCTNNRNKARRKAKKLKS